MILSWTTATENNNRGFEIERNTGSWETIGFIQGAGTSSEPKAYSFTDVLNTNNPNTIYYRLKQIDFDGTYNYSNEVQVHINVPLRFSLTQNYPNPFNPSTRITYTIPEDGLVSLKVYNPLGRQVAELVNEVVRAGTHTVTFNTVGGTGISSGVYFYRLEAGNRVTVRKMVLLK